MAEQTFTRKLSRGDIGWSQSYLVGSPSRSCFLDQFSLTNYFLWLFAIHLVELANLYTLLFCLSKKWKLPNLSCDFTIKDIAKVGNTVPDVPGPGETVVPDVDGRNHFGVGNYSNGLVTSLPLVPLSRLYGDAVLIFIKMVPIWIIQLLAPNQNFLFSKKFIKNNWEIEYKNCMNFAKNW